jgi:hypothetical protein
MGMIKRRPRSIPILNLYAVKSSNIDSMGRIGTSTFVLYKNNSLYLFKNMAEQQYLDIMNSESIGKALHATGLKGEKIEIPANMVKHPATTTV